MTDEAHFHLNSFVNKQNFSYWEVENPRILNENKSWCTIMCDRIIGTYFFENAKGFTEIVNGERYRYMLNTFL